MPGRFIYRDAVDLGLERGFDPDDLETVWMALQDLER
jgi:hypothetical protein